MLVHASKRLRDLCKKALAHHDYAVLDHLIAIIASGEGVSEHMVEMVHMLVKKFPSSEDLIKGGVDPFVVNLAAVTHRARQAVTELYFTELQHWEVEET